MNSIGTELDTPWSHELWRSTLLREPHRQGTAVARHYASALPISYATETDPAQAIRDVAEVERLDVDSVALTFTTTEASAPYENLKIYAVGKPAPLNEVLPILSSLGVNALDERPAALTRPDGHRAWIYDLTVDLVAVTDGHGVTRDSRIADAFRAAWTGETEVDGFNALVLHAGLGWRQVTVLRAYAAYLRQAGLPYSRSNVERVLLSNSAITKLLVEFHALRLDPGIERDAAAEDALEGRTVDAIDAVAGIDADRILRALLSLIRATTRTTYYAEDRRAARALAFKFDSSSIDELPLPRPKYEAYVYSPRMEGVHLRFDDVARGGIRWSDRRDDFRTEILGLVKAQAVKNAVIVPAGAKGGFVVKNPPVPTGDAAADREAMYSAGISCYREFISSLLDMTDNLDITTRQVIAPEGIVRRDGDDTYLVVAADKGTAAFSDVANAIALERGYWLGDGFASGGSVGYDHKAMGITARGAWESVMQHFREMGVDTRTDDFTVVGIGDMSGDVFGNGMLLSPHIRLLAAFDHRHVFIDPDPDPQRSWDERARLFGLGRSSWKDYDKAVLSDGAMIVDRSAKSVRLTPQARRVLGIDDDPVLTTVELVRAVLGAPADLLWNGGVGTYVKATTESHADVGDKSNDAVRLDAPQLRVRVVGEGGNLGLTQLGRIEYARNGGRVNTDALDNSAGVDCSDHEVNIKIALAGATADNTLAAQDRRELLSDMTDDVSRLVLADNRSQNEMMSLNRAQAGTLVSFHSRMVDDLERRGHVDRAIDVLPTSAQFGALEREQKGLTSPELAQLTAQVKRFIKSEVSGTTLPDNGVYAGRLHNYFPPRLGREFAHTVAAHPLRREIVTTSVVNDMVDRAGMTYAFRLREETGADSAEAVNAFTAVTEIFDLGATFERIRAAADATPTAGTNALTVQTQRLIDRASRWLTTHRPQPLPLEATIARYRPVVRDLGPRVREWLRGDEITAVERRTEALTSRGAEAGLAADVADLLHTYCLLDIVDIAEISQHRPEDVAELYFALSAHLHINTALTAVTALPRLDLWHALARLALRDDLYSSLRAITLDALSVSEPGDDAADKVDQWEQHNAARLARARALLTEIESEVATEPTLALISVAARRIRAMTR
ncbi:glutamate dehydrogenase [Rhodococcus percolatus]|uniref:NAD-glutamate dehydrogenase domain-containing protein n=1 Tax=Rhodococcus opacus TaxID=37919 RepID=UPI0015FC8DC4|nr:NAD-glutamate dehydrogenase domain-containing protein [Rhodococcus opacus]MBA8961216.1 glutamate dehydrogenase [Rhodococcus opacus]MBP2202920.1 glutamate dehydrogenase [Rhodococcus opacus]